MVLVGKEGLWNNKPSQYFQLGILAGVDVCLVA
ncbi:hypothetical protein SVI_3614 [Shewanella violacea DSS12]|uniref:Uncharacterized protein n=1 Tax=Shewanella violacea (strain JCM 10179 / CIP 106290 / LMG 19151 / DSS12) TaxID=637905 RepID=D4ZC40_SHEVD|nr:hypothetical protein SVI_3614 [Shewanella violacea DSS12]